MTFPPRADSVNLLREPFDDDRSSDTIFRTSDGIDFHVHRVVLFLASPFFRDVFSLPQPSSADEVKPVIEVTESSQTLDPLLRLCYPVDDPVMNDLALVGDVLEAALKYQLSEATKMLTKMFRTFIHGSPLKVFGISCRLQLEEEASLAAHRWKEISPNVDGGINENGKFLDWKATIAGASYVDEMSDISAGAYHRLTQFVRTGTEKSFCTPQKIKRKSEATDLVNDKTAASHEFNFSDSDLTVISSDGVEFQVHELILRLASSDMMQNVTVNEHGRRHILLPEDSHTLAKLFEIYYPTADPDLSDLSLAFPLLHVAQKYKMEKAIKTLKAVLKAHMCEEPLRTYLTFVRNGFMEDAIEVVRNVLLQQPISGLYVPEMEDIPAKWQYQLLEYRHQCLSTLVEVCAKYDDIDLDWWTVAVPNYSMVPAPTLPSFAIPVVQSKLLSLQKEARSYYQDLQNRYGKKYKSSVFNIATFSLNGIQSESKRLEGEVALELSKIELQLSLTCSSVYKTTPADLSKGNSSDTF